MHTFYFWLIYAWLGLLVDFDYLAYSIFALCTGISNAYILDENNYHT